MGGGSSLPYDAEVEYLESTGTQYINTGIYASGTSTEVELDMCGKTGKAFLFGARTAYNNKAFVIANGGTSGSSYDYFFFNYGNSYKTPSFPLETRMLLRATNNLYRDNGTYATISAQSFTTAQTLLMFAANYNGTINYGHGRVYGCKIYNNGVLVRDFVPVRKRGVGYMYDFITGSLFGNQGTGSFVIGADKLDVSSIIDVEYLQATGTQYISTGYIPNADTELEIKYKVTQLQSSLNNGLAPFGCRVGFDNKQLYAFSPINNSNRFYLCYGNQHSEFNYTVLDEVITIHVSNGEMTLNGTPYTFSNFNFPDLPVYLFAFNNNWAIGLAPGSVLNIEHFWIKENNQYIMNMKPVRVGTGGYMYDMVKNKLYGSNAISESFLYGPDKT
jgi:hypothetical protein